MAPVPLRLMGHRLSSSSPGLCPLSCPGVLFSSLAPQPRQKPSSLHHLTPPFRFQPKMPSSRKPACCNPAPLPRGEAPLKARTTKAPLSWPRMSHHTSSCDTFKSMHFPRGQGPCARVAAPSAQPLLCKAQAQPGLPSTRSPRRIPKTSLMGQTLGTSAGGPPPTQTDMVQLLAEAFGAVLQARDQKNTLPTEEIELLIHKRQAS